MKTCPRCRVVSPDEATRCDCGYNFTRPSASRPDPVSGIGGWLLLLCCSLGVLAPAIVVLRLAWLQQRLGHFRTDREHYGALVWTLLLMGTAAALASVYAAWKLLKRRKGAIGTTVAALGGLIVFWVGYAALPFAFNMHYDEFSNREVSAKMLRDGLVRLPELVLWLAYLGRSRRVASTYAEPDKPAYERLLG